MRLPPEARYDVVMALTYYRPYVSGLSEAARLVAEGLAERGLRVATATTRYQNSLPLRENLNGVDVYRSGVIASAGKGVISPGFVPLVRRLSKVSDIVNLHLPLLEAGLLAKASKAPVVITYQCDVDLGPSILNRLIVRVMDASSRKAIGAAGATVFSSEDYRDSSRNAPSDLADTLAIRPPFIDRSGGSPSFRKSAGLHVGFLGRIVAEKGLDYLLSAFARLPDSEARLLLAGDYKAVAGGSVIDKLHAQICEDPRVELLGFIPDDKVADFFASIDVFALPSTNSLEAYGIVQIEAMSAGVPVVSSDRPGVRVPVREFGMGQVVSAGDVKALSDALMSVRSWHTGNDPTELRARLAASDPVDSYLRLFERIRSQRRNDTETALNGSR